MALLILQERWPCASGQKQMCHLCVGSRILNFFARGQVPIESTKFYCHGKAVKGAGIFSKCT